MERKFKAAIFLTILIFAAAAILNSCKTNDSNPKTEDNGHSANTGENAADPESAHSIPDNLPERDFGGYNFRMLIFENLNEYGSGMYIEEENGDIIDDAIYKRNKTVEERFNIDISPVYYPRQWDNRMDGSKSIIAGIDAFDMMFLHMRVAFQYAERNLLVDWFDDMPYVDLNAPWWSQDAVQDLSLFGRLHGAGGDISAAKLNNTMCLFFNKNLFQSLDIEYPYIDVASGKWTLDKFMSIIKNGSGDLNGDGAITPDADRYGFGMRNIFYYPTTVPYCGGDKVIKKGNGGEPVLSIYNERTMDIFEKLLEILGSGAACVAAEKNWGNPQGAPIFNDGRALFADGIMGEIITFRALEFDIGLLPTPKYEESTPKYNALIEAHGGLIAVPVTVSDFEAASIITEALCAEGHKIIIPAHYEKALKTKFARDDESSEMLDYIKNSGVYDYGYAADNITLELGSIGYYFLNNPNFASLYEKNEARVQANLNKLSENN